MYAYASPPATGANKQAEPDEARNVAADASKTQSELAWLSVLQSFSTATPRADANYLTLRSRVLAFGVDVLPSTAVSRGANDSQADAPRYGEMRALGWVTDGIQKTADHADNTDQSVWELRMSLQSQRIDLFVKHCLLAALLAIAIARVAWAENPPVQSIEKSGESSKSEPSKTEPMTVRMTVYPALPPVAVMKHRLLPGYLEKVDGNAALQYLKGSLPEALGTRLQERQDQIADLLDGEMKDFDVERARALMAEIGDNTFEYLRLASRRRDVDWGMPFQEHRIYEIMIPEVQQMRQFGRYLALRARVQIADGKIEDAIATLRVGYSLARHIAEGPTLINGLVGVAVGAIMNQRLRELQARPEMENLYWTLAALPDPLIDLSTAMEVESDAVFAMFPQIKDVATADLTPEQWNVRLWEFMRSLSSLTPLLSEGDAAKDWKEKLMEGVGAAMIVTTFLPKARTDLEAMGWSKDRLAAMAPAQIVLLHIAEVYQELRDATFKWFHVPYWQAQTPDEEKEILVGGKLRTEIIPLARLLLPAINAARFAAMRSARDMAAMQTVEAVRAYAAEHDGKLPAKLEDITKYPVPLDPTKGALFDYRVDGKTFTLESPAPASRQKSDGLRYIVTLAERTKDTPKAGERVRPSAQKPKVDKPPAKEKQTSAASGASKVAGGIVRALSKNPVAEALESSRRSQSMNNLRQIAIAMHGYHDSHKGLPAPAIAGKDGKPLLSWRVALLPYLENQCCTTSSISTSRGTASTTRS